MNTIRVIAGLALLMLCGQAWGQRAPLDDERPTIRVTGEALVNVVPDKIVISFGIETWDTNMFVAKENNNRILKSAKTAMKQLDLSDKDIQTDHLSVEPRWHDDYRQKFIGYFVRNSVVATLTDTAKIEQLVTAVLQAGVNYIHSVNYETTEFKKYREQAREAALTAAREKADKMAAVLGRSAGAPIRIEEGYSGSPSYWSNWSGWGYGRRGGMSQNVIQDARDGSGDTGETIALGKISIRASVGVTFELED